MAGLPQRQHPDREAVAQDGGLAPRQPRSRRHHGLGDRPRSRTQGRRVHALSLPPPARGSVRLERGL